MKKIFILFTAIVFAVGCGNRYDSVDAQEFAKVLENPEVQLIDTRAPEDFNKGHIPGALNIYVDSEDFYEQMNRIDKSRPVAIYCRGGRQSEIAAERFAGEGYNVTELEGGLITWEGEIETESEKE